MLALPALCPIALFHLPVVYPVDIPRLQLCTTNLQCVVIPFLCFPWTSSSRCPVYLPALLFDLRRFVFNLTTTLANYSTRRVCALAPSCDPLWPRWCLRWSVCYLTGFCGVLDSSWVNKCYPDHYRPCELLVTPILICRFSNALPFCYSRPIFLLDH